mmetsp:Transcript_4184/g.5362  ORF Transcript_4184/g.5362 Transcript_4184/m.5362 type:complete len:150 (-) Transcript_4184:45-494(-)|eukprot:scaffold239864_cov32-Tisochrysis_lutea.AAC.1
MRDAVQHNIKELLAKLREYAASQLAASDSASHNTSTLALIKAMEAGTRGLRRMGGGAGALILPNSVCGPCGESHGGGCFARHCQRYSGLRTACRTACSSSTFAPNSLPFPLPCKSFCFGIGGFGSCALPWALRGGRVGTGLMAVQLAQG